MPAPPPPGPLTQPSPTSQARALPRPCPVGEHVLGLGPDAWRKGPYADPYSVVHAVEHRATPGSKLDPTTPAKEDPTVTLLFQALWPGDGPLAGPRMLREYDAQAVTFLVG